MSPEGRERCSSILGCLSITIPSLMQARGDEHPMFSQGLCFVLVLFL